MGQLCSASFLAASLQEDPYFEYDLFYKRECTAWIAC